MSVRQMDCAPPSGKTRLHGTDLLCVMPLHYANFIVRHVTDVILQHSFKKIAECDMADDIGREVFASENGQHFR